MTKTNGSMLAEYNQWANQTLIVALEKVPAEELVRQRVSLFRDICHTLNHMLVIERIWQAHIQERDHGYTARNTPDYPDFPELAGQLIEMDRWFVEWARDQTDVSFEKSVRFNYVNGQSGQMTLGQILQHVVVHNSYHRGYVGDFMFQIEGYRAPQMDLSVYCTDVMSASSGESVAPREI